MKKKMTFLWIDDESNRIKEKQPIEEELNVTIDFEDVNKKDIVKELTRILGNSEPDMVLIDHKLDKLLDSSLIGTGATVAEIIREKWPECPIVAITNVDLKDIPLHKQLLYEEIVEYTRISERYSTFYSIASSFRQLKKHRPSDTDQLMKILRPPKD